MGVTGFYVCGSTGEAFLLSEDERKNVMEAVKSFAPYKTLIAHIGSIDERVEKIFPHLQSRWAMMISRRLHRFTISSALMKLKTAIFE